MKIKFLMISTIFVVFLALALPLDSEAGARKDAKTQGDEHTYQESGQPLYFDPERMQGKGVDDAAPYSDPWYGKEEEYKGGHGRQRGPAGQTEDPTDVKIIEGPVRYERVKD